MKIYIKYIGDGMHRRIHLKKKYLLFKKKPSKMNLVILIVLLLILAIYGSFRFINNKVTPILMEYAELQVGRMATQVIRQAVSKEVTDKISVDDLFLITRDSNGEIKTIDLNPIHVNRMTGLVTEKVSDYLTKVENGEIDNLNLSADLFDSQKVKKGIIFEIPSGIVFKNPILTNVGPKIPVKLNLIGDIATDVKTKVTNYGINNALIEVLVYVEVTEQVILPFASKRVKVEMNVPIALKLIQGTVPNYYFNGTPADSNLSIPIQ